MEINYTIPLWGVIALSIPLTITAIGGAIKLWYRVKSQDERIKAQDERIDDLEEVVNDKHNKLYNEIKALDAKFSAQNDLLIEIKTILGLLTQNKIKQ